jgi:hypothetical protein
MQQIARPIKSNVGVEVVSPISADGDTHVNQMCGFRLG